LYEAARRGDWKEAMRLQRKLWAVNQAFSKYALAACIKGGLELQGFDVGVPIAPQQRLTEDGFREMRSVLEQTGD
jgi:4-hydroxy-tetrahydrodipicolinate synthase